jgi:hypothetical protein
MLRTIVEILLAIWLLGFVLQEEGSPAKLLLGIALEVLLDDMIAS